MQRRSHKKSRKGCFVCKKRHLKCDEGNPRCANCTIAELECSYPVQALKREASKQAPPASQAPVSAASPSSLSSGTGEIFPAAGPDDLLFLNINHLELLHHFSTMAANPFSKAHRDLVVRIGLGSTYLMHEMLSFASLHLSHLQPAKRDFLRRQAMQLQTTAFRLFNTTIPDVSPTTAAPMLLFSRLVGLHALHETVETARDDPNAYLDGFISYMQIHRAINIVTNRHWRFLVDESELSPMLKDTEFVDQDPRGEECAGLRHSLAAENLTEDLRQVHEEAIDWLQLMHDTERDDPKTKVVSHRRTAWALKIQEPFLECLAQRRPVSLMILQHYALAMQKEREEWVIGEAGLVLANSIEKTVQKQQSGINNKFA